MVWHGVAYWDSGLTVAEYCRQRGLMAKSASRWIGRLRPADAGPAEPSLAFGHDSGLRLEVGAVRIALAADFAADTLRRLSSSR